jgi:hypothetical protein
VCWPGAAGDPLPPPASIGATVLARVQAKMSRARVLSGADGGRQAQAVRAGPRRLRQVLAEVRPTRGFVGDQAVGTGGLERGKAPSVGSCCLARSWPSRRRAASSLGSKTVSL